jgi:hypothetical protein
MNKESHIQEESVIRGNGSGEQIIRMQGGVPDLNALIQIKRSDLLRLGKGISGLFRVRHCANTSTFTSMRGWRP